MIARTTVLRLEKSVVNPLVLRLLRSPVHRLLSRRLLVLSYEGRRSGREFSTPVLYRRDGDDLVLLTPTGETSWWKNFRDGHPLSVRLRGTQVAGTGEVCADEGSVFETLRWASTPLWMLGRLVPGRTFADEDALRERTDEFVTVRVTLEGTR